MTSQQLGMRDKNIITYRPPTYLHRVVRELGEQDYDAVMALLDGRYTCAV
jgi:hypothetical protein